MPAKEDSFYHLIGEFSIVVHAKAGVDLAELLEKHTQWMGEPDSDGGVVIAMKLKRWHDPKKSTPKPEAKQEKEEGPEQPGYSKCETKECPMHGKADVCKYPDNCRRRT